MKRNSPILLALAGVLMLAGCESSTFTTTTVVTPVATEPDIVTVKLAQAADKASKALDIMSSIDQQRNPNAAPLEDYSNVPSNLMLPVSLRWSGPIEQVTKALADRAGMRFHVKGTRPPTPVLINVDAYQVPILHILRDVGLQAGRRADVSVDVPNGVVEVRYAPTDQSEMTHADEIK